MIILNECRIDSAGKKLIIEASIENLSYYKDVYIDSVVIDNDITYVPNGPSDKPVYTKKFDLQSYSNINNGDCECGTEDITKGLKHIRLAISAKELNSSNLNDNIFFVYVIASGIPSSSTPCGMDNTYVMGIAVNLRPIYNMAMGYIKELENNCNTPKGFIDMILRLKAFELSLRTGHYPEAIKYWHRLFKDKKSITTKSGCGCNGI